MPSIFFVTKRIIPGTFLFVILSFCSGAIKAEVKFDPDSTEKSMLNFYEVGSYDQATPLSFQLLFFYKQAKNIKKETEILVTIGEIYRGSHSYDFSLKYLKRGLRKAIHTEDSIQISRAYNRLSAVYFEKSNLELALSYADSSDAIAKLLSITNHQISNLNLRGAISRTRKNFTNSQKYLNEALELAIEHNNIDNIISAHLNIAQLSLSTNNPEEALGHAKIAIDIANENKLTSHLVYAYMVLARSYQKQGDFKKAFEYLSLQYDLDSESRNKSTKQRIDLLNASLDTEKKIRENAELTQQVSENKNRWMWAGLIALFAISAFSIQTLRVRSRNSMILLKKDEEIKNQNLELQEANAAKDRLFSILSHDLISPISFLSETLALVTDEDVSIEDAKPVLKKLQVQTFHIRELTENVLTWARSQMGGSFINLEIANIAFPVKRTLGHVSPIADHKEINLIFEEPEKELLANIDVEIVRFVTRNILMNAIKFTNSGKSIHIKIVKKDHLVQIIIKDEGIGIPKEKFSTLFRFKAQRSYGTSKERGTGLGLPMCFDLITKIGGTIEFESTENVGSTFTCSYPMA